MPARCIFQVRSAPFEDRALPDVTRCEIGQQVDEFHAVGRRLVHRNVRCPVGGPVGAEGPAKQVIRLLIRPALEGDGESPPGRRASDDESPRCSVTHT